MLGYRLPGLWAQPWLNLEPGASAAFPVERWCPEALGSRELSQSLCSLQPSLSKAEPWAITQRNGREKGDPPPVSHVLTRSLSQGQLDSPHLPTWSWALSGPLWGPCWGIPLDSKLEEVHPGEKRILS